MMSGLRWSLRVLLTMAIFIVAGAGPGVAGSWKLEFDSRDTPSLSYSQDGKTVFVMGCGRAFGFHAKYPGTPKKNGKASITVGDARSSMKLLGEFEEADGDDQTTFVQWDLGFSRQDPELFGKQWERKLRRLLDIIERADPLTVSGEGSSYKLPRIDVSNWRAPLEKCGRV